MSIEDALYEIEMGFWTGGADHYRAHLDARCLTVFAEMAAVLGVEQIAQSVDDSRWQAPVLARRGYVSPTEDFAIISYEASARKAGRSYRANVSSGYVRRGQDWKLAFHQQTPFEAK